MENFLCGPVTANWNTVWNRYWLAYLVSLVFVLIWPLGFLICHGLNSQVWALGLEQTTYTWYHIAVFPPTCGIFVATFHPAMNRKWFIGLVVTAVMCALGWTTFELLTGPAVPYIQQSPAEAMDRRKAVVEQHELIEERYPDFNFKEMNEIMHPESDLVINGKKEQEPAESAYQRYECRRKKYEQAIGKAGNNPQPTIRLNIMEYLRTCFEIA